MKFSLIIIVFIAVILAIIPQILYALVKLVSLIFDINVRYRHFGYASLGIFIVCMCLMAYGNLYGRFRYEVKPFTYTNADIPASFDGYRIVHISDIHSGGWVDHPEKLQNVIDTINALDADLICFTGDLADISPDEVTPLVPILKQLKAKDGVISILGNHDYFPYMNRDNMAKRNKDVEKLKDIERNQLSWNLLLNDNIAISRNKTADRVIDSTSTSADTIYIIGSENHSMGTHRVIQRGKLMDAMNGSEGHFRILLTHDPTHWSGEVVPKTDIPLTLSGHTHAMQFRVFGFTPSRFAYPECDGLYKKGDQTLYVNIGLGGSIRMRIGATPEITVITLKK